MAGSISLSLSQQFDSLGDPLNGGKLYFIQAGTTATPQNAFQDSSLTIPHPNPLTLDSAGRIGQLYFADGSIKIRLTNSDGITQVVADNVLVVGPSGGGGGGGTVDPTTVLQPGAIVPYYGTGLRSGFVRANGRTLGNSTSGATEYAAADALGLFTVLYADPNLVVSSGRAGNAAADFAAGKNITLPDWRGRAIAGLADMGNTATAILTSTYFGADPTVLGAAGGAQSKLLTRPNLPNVAPTFAGAAQAWALNQTDIVTWGGNTTTNGGSAGLVPVAGNMTRITPTVTVTPAGTIQDINGGVTQAAFSAVPPLMLATIYLKL